MRYKNKLLICSLILGTSTILSGCGTQEEANNDIPSGNQKPVIELSASSLSVDEGQSGIIAFTAVDLDGDKLTLSLSQTGKLGKAELGEGKITYTAPKNLSEDSTDTLTLTATDGKDKVSKTISVSLINSSNEAPILTVSSASLTMGQNEQTDADAISVLISDKDEDPLSLSFKNGSFIGTYVTVTPTLTKVDVGKYVLGFKSGNLSQPSEQVTGTLVLSDGQEETTVDIKVTVSKTPDMVTPVITAPSSMILKEGQDNVLQYQISDPDTTTSSLSVSYSLDSDFSGNIVMDSTKNSITFNNITVSSPQTVIMTLTVTDGVYSSSQDVTLNILNNVDTDMEDFTALYLPIKSMYYSVYGRMDELSLLSVYKEIAKVVSPEKIISFDSYDSQIRSNFTNERNNMEVYISEIDAFIALNQQTTDKYTEMTKKINDLKSLIDLYGSTSIPVLNNANKDIGSLLPILYTTQKLKTFTINGTNYYSRYIGDATYGSFNADKTVWTFSTPYKYMEVINFLSTSCSSQ